MTVNTAYSDALKLANQASIDSGRVDHLINRPAEGVHVPVDSLTLDREQGIIGDRWATTAWMKLPDGSPDPRVQVSLTNTKVMHCFTGSSEGAVFACGDNLYVDFNLTEQHLRVGARLKIGSAVLEVSDVINDACGKFAQRFGAEALKLVRTPENSALRLRGIFCSIVESGQICIGDSIECHSRP
jgi:MOSC domain-containing protein YiiM